MKFPSDLYWGLTKKSNSNLVKFNGKQFTHDAYSLNNMHCASQVASSSHTNLGVAGKKEKTEKGNRRVFVLDIQHKLNHGITKRKAHSQSKVDRSVIEVRTEVNHAAKTIKGLTYQNDKTKKAALRRLARLSYANRSNVRSTSRRYAKN
eukprot:CAMPEP_0116870320 /NCGR_PEP_ID=MMETSP0463-20121206/193_1 /TAXON_ID=181622 /ORGANISM="Strombidinopsis sp, Strain SopsisLIS2011" /LENGTH=148 /DNA_ID=CAMNT_0004506669 /DNA_START=117 /DNA_END=563 /DNA_ORIENTATION=+